MASPLELRSWRPLVRTPRVRDLVWPGPDGQPMPAQTLFSRRWLPMRKGARIRAVSFHALRHTAATLALEDGQPPHVVAAMLGHASVANDPPPLRPRHPCQHGGSIDAIDARYGPRPRVLTEELLAQYWPSNHLLVSPGFVEPDYWTGTLLFHQKDSMGIRGYPAEFRQRVLDLVAAGKGVRDVASDLGISEPTVYSWRRQERVDRAQPDVRQAHGVGGRARVSVSSHAAPESGPTICQESGVRHLSGATRG